MSARTMPARQLVKGIPLVLGADTYTLPPASLGTLELMAERLDKINEAFASGANFSHRDLFFVADLATACLQRNYPELDRAQVAQHVGLENVIDVLQMCMDTSGLLRQKLEADAQADQKQAAQAAAGEGGKLGESAGTASSPTS